MGHLKMGSTTCCDRNMAPTN